MGLPRFMDARVPDMVADYQAAADYGVDEMFSGRRMGRGEFGSHRCDV